MSAPYPKADDSWDVCADQYTPITDADIDRAAASLRDPSPVAEAIADIAEEFSKYDPFMMGHGDGSGEPWVPEEFVGRPEISVGVCCGDMAHCMAPDCDSSKLNRDARKAYVDAAWERDLAKLRQDASASAEKASVLREKFAPEPMPANPKQAYGDTKVPLHLFPSTAIVVGSMCMGDGRGKYGQDNFRAAPVEAMTYVRAAMLHLLYWAEGEDNTTDSLLPHLGHALASVAILIDASYAGSLIDNRKYPGGYQRAIEDMQKHVKRIHDTHADKSPKHWTIEDAK